MTKLIKHAKRELALITEEGDEQQDKMNALILSILLKYGYDAFYQGSSEYVRNAIERLTQYKPLSPLTGEDDEWKECIGNGKGTRTFQNLRCPSVFREVDKEGGVLGVFDVGSARKSDDGGITWYFDADCAEDVTFPYVPPTKPREIYVQRIGGVEIDITGCPENIEVWRKFNERELRKRFEED